MSKCKQIFGNIFVTFRSIKLKLTSIIWSFRLWSEISFKSDKRLIISPKTPIVKIASFRQSHNVAESGRFLQWGYLGKFFICCRIQLKFCFRARVNPSNERGEFELDCARCYKSIPDISIALDMRRTVVKYWTTAVETLFWTGTLLDRWCMLSPGKWRFLSGYLNTMIR